MIDLNVLLRLPFTSGQYISLAGLERLRHYRYHATSSSWLEDVLIEPLFNAALPLIPLWMAPNLLSVLALSASTTACALLVGTSLAANGAAPPAWALLTAALLMATYQLLDGVDGKQARRTGSSSPLGQLFDHGVDALASVYNSMILVTLWGLYGSLSAWLIVLSSCSAFFFSNWEETVTGSMRFGTIGPTEAQLTVIGVLLTSAVTGRPFWTAPLVPALPLTLATFFTCGGVLGVVYQIVSTLLQARNAWHRLNAERQGEALRRLMGFVSFLCLVVLLALSPDPSVQQSAPLYLSLAALLSVYLSSRLVLCHVTDQPFAVVFPILYPLPFLVLHCYCPYLPLLPTRGVGCTVPPRRSADVRALRVQRRARHLCSSATPLLPHPREEGGMKGAARSCRCSHMSSGRMMKEEGSW